MAIAENATVDGVIAGMRQRRRVEPPRMLDDGRVRARLRPWPNQPTSAQLVLTDHTKAPSITTLEEWIRVIKNHGFTAVRTGALSASATGPFDELGFEPIQTLALLRLDLTRDMRFGTVQHELRTIRGTRHLAVAARLDLAAFENGWELDPSSILDACHATPAHRIRLAITSTDQPAGYIITGRNGAAGFIQRLAVDPGLEGQGIGTSLLSDGLTWLHRRGVREVLVNTNFDNHRALALYERFGFRLLPESLHVLEKSLGECT
jgi:ribosomal protein S18 acetylase RimI-like enzyme